MAFTRSRVSLGALESNLARLHEPDAEFAFTVHTGDAMLDSLLGKIQDARLLPRQLADWTLEVLAHPIVAELSSRDAGFLVALSHQRVHQLRTALAAPPPPR